MSKKKSTVTSEQTMSPELETVTQSLKDQKAKLSEKIRELEAELENTKLTSAKSNRHLLRCKDHQRESLVSVSQNHLLQKQM